MTFTVDQILGMAPDPASAKSGKDLAVTRKWVTLGCDQSAAWGECQGSGALPYQTRVDLQDVAFKCSCPSRKFPCKHSLGLLLLLTLEPGAFTQKEAPAWVVEWLSTRHVRAEKKVKQKEEGDKPVDAAAQAKRQEQRKIKVAAGIGELDRFLQDTIRQGLAAVQDKTYAFWENAAARLVDAQASGLARLIRDCAGISATGEGWQERLLAQLSKIYLLVEAYNRLEQLPPDLQEDVRNLIGYTVDQDELLKLDGVKDVWEVIGQKVEQEDRLRMQRTWMRGRNSKRWALILNFAHGTAPMENKVVPGTALEAELVFMPGAFPLRALLKTKSEQSIGLTDFGADTVNGALQQYSDALAKNPWIERFPMSLQRVVPIPGADGDWTVCDQEGNMLALSVNGNVGWQLLALSGGYPISVLGEWDGTKVTPLTVATGSGFHRLRQE